jgi:hydrogenase expression/formation protein HypC
MCIGIPMLVQESGIGYAQCINPASGEIKQVDTLLVGDQAAGSWLLVFLGSAREVLDEQTASQISDALKAVELAMQGEEQLDHLFADLIDREPVLPEFLRKEQ